VVYIDDRWFYGITESVPEEIYEVEIGKGIIRKVGTDVTLVATSYMAFESVKAVQQLAGEGIDVELIDLRTVKPLDHDLILESVKKTGRLVVADGGWKTCGVAAEIAALVGEAAFQYLKAPIRRITLPDCPAPASSTLERVYYPTAETIAQSVRELLLRRNKRTQLNKPKKLSEPNKLNKLKKLGKPNKHAERI
jgi:acetoin:2,6-dichlorophenolindophenol oxidoreductase subunit beta